MAKKSKRRTAKKRKTSRRKPIKRKTKRRTVRKATTRRVSKRSAPKKRKMARRKSKKLDVAKAVGAGAIVAIGEPLLDQLAAKVGLTGADDFVKIGVGLWGAKRGGATGVAGQTLAVLGVRNLVSNAMSGQNLFGNLLGGTSTSTSTNTVQVV